MSETTGKRDVVQRHQIADYLNIGTSESPNWVLMGVGFTSLNETFGAESESSKYVNEASESSSVTSYKSVFPFEAHLIILLEQKQNLNTVEWNCSKEKHRQNLPMRHVNSWFLLRHRPLKAIRNSL